MNRSLRELVRRVAPIGWTYDGITPGGHARLVHTSGAVYITPATTSDKARGNKNALAELERIGGQKLPRVKKGRSRRKRQVDQQVEASRRRHRERFEATHEQRQAERDAADRIYRAAVRAAADDQRRKEIESLMRP